MPEPADTPPERTVLIGKAISKLVARAPWAWPLVKGRVGHFFDESARGWDERTGSGSADHLAALAAAVGRVKQRPESVLDVGCGTGSGTLFLAREFPTARIRGVDLSEAMINEANRKIGLDPEARVAFRVGDASKLPWPDRHFDPVAQANLPDFFTEGDRVLRPGGHVVITSSLGMDTPFSTPHDLLEKRFAKLGIDMVDTGDTGPGTWFMARKAAGS